MSKKPAKRKAKKTRRGAPTIVPLNGPAEVEQRHKGTVYIQVGEVLVPTRIVRMKPLESPLVDSDSPGPHLTAATVVEEGPRTRLDTVSVPSDLDEAIEAEGHRRFERWRKLLLSGSALEKVSLESESVKAAIQDVRWQIRNAVEAGFYLALTRYAPGLKELPGALSLRRKNRKASRKGIEAIKRKNAQRNKEIRTLFRQLRKTCPKKGARCLRIAKDYPHFKVKAEQIARIVEGID